MLVPHKRQMPYGKRLFGRISLYSGEAIIAFSPKVICHGPFAARVTSASGFFFSLYSTFHVDAYCLPSKLIMEYFNL